jgi:hypothetical protein
MHMKAIPIALVACLASGSVAHANTNVAACVAKLSADGQLIFNTVRSELGPNVELRPLVRAKAIALVGAGKVSQAAAPDAALAATACIELLRK